VLYSDFRYIKKELFVIPVTVLGIPAQAEITHYRNVKPWRGSAQSCPSDLDWYGYTEIEFELYDRKGYRAEWLDAKIDGNKEEIQRIEEQILYWMKENENANR